MGEPGHELVAYDRDDLDYEDILTPDNLYNCVFNDGINLHDVNGEWIPAALRALRPAGRAIGAGVGKVIVHVGKKRAANAFAKAQREELKRRAKRATECAAIHAAYDALVCRKCTPCMKCSEIRTGIVCWTSKVAGRGEYLRKKCDYYLPGSIGSAIGSKGKEANHKAELVKASAKLAECTSYLAICIE